MSHMQPEIIESAYWELETTNGIEIVPTDVADLPPNSALATLEEIQEAFSDYCLGEIESAERFDSGFCYRLSAPGYMDCADWSAAETLQEAIAELLGNWGDGFDMADFEALASCLEGFDEFWEGYLQALGRTAQIWEQDEEPESLFDCNGDDILPEEVLQLLSAEEQQSLFADCLDFFLSAIEIGFAAYAFDNTYTGPDYTRAGSDFHLTRNGHGAGFWDGDWINGDKLTGLAKPYGTCELMAYTGDNGALAYSIGN